MAKIAFVGLGNMGLPMAKNLVNAGHDVTGFDLSSEALLALKSAGGGIADTVAAAVEGAEVVVSMLPAGRHVLQVYTGEDGVLAHAGQGTVMIDSSTIDVDSARKVAEAAGTAGMLMVDAPVSGGVGGAEAGTLTFMVGGPDAAFEKAKPFLQVMGKNIFHAGGAGNGQAAKICNNMMLGIQMISVCEAFGLADRLGLERQKLFDIASTASGQCWSLTTYCPVPGPVPTSPANREWKPGFAVDMMLKDLKLAQEAAMASNAHTPLGANAAQLFSIFSDQGHGDMDFSAILKIFAGELN